MTYSSSLWFTMTFDNVVHYLHPPSFTPKVPVECPNCQSSLITVDNKQVAQNPVDPTIPTQRKRCPQVVHNCSHSQSWARCAKRKHCKIREDWGDNVCAKKPNLCAGFVCDKKYCTPNCYAPSVIVSDKLTMHDASKDEIRWAWGTTRSWSVRMTITEKKELCCLL